MNYLGSNTVLEKNINELIIIDIQRAQDKGNVKYCSCHSLFSGVKKIEC